MPLRAFSSPACKSASSSPLCLSLNCSMKLRIEQSSLINQTQSLQTALESYEISCPETPCSLMLVARISIFTDTKRCIFEFLLLADEELTTNFCKVVAMRSCSAMEND